ncbi:MAG: hypothetical protein H7335_16740, partial [Massilia sp.]|nr:hypothetical protein [Massilia sp.]
MHIRLIRLWHARLPASMLALCTLMLALMLALLLAGAAFAGKQLAHIGEGVKIT